MTGFSGGVICPRGELKVITLPLKGNRLELRANVNGEASKGNRRNQRIRDSPLRGLGSGLGLFHLFTCPGRAGVDDYLEKILRSLKDRFSRQGVGTLSDADAEKRRKTLPWY